MVCPWQRPSLQKYIRLQGTRVALDPSRGLVLGLQWLVVQPLVSVPPGQVEGEQACSQVWEPAGFWESRECHPPATWQLSPGKQPARRQG